MWGHEKVEIILLISSSGNDSSSHCTIIGKPEAEESHLAVDYSETEHTAWWD